MIDAPPYQSGALVALAAKLCSAAWVKNLALSEASANITIAVAVEHTGDIGFAAIWGAASAISCAALGAIPFIMRARREGRESDSIRRQREWTEAITTIHTTYAFKEKALIDTHKSEILTLQDMLKVAQAREALGSISRHAIGGAFHNLQLQIRTLREILISKGETPPDFKDVDIQELLGPQDEQLKEIVHKSIADTL